MKTAVPGSERASTELRTRRSSVAPPLAIRRTTASPWFQALITGRGRPGPGTRASGETVVGLAVTVAPVVAGAAAVVPAVGLVAVEAAAVLGEGVPALTELPATGAVAEGG